jgi:hypothetical protein
MPAPINEIVRRRVVQQWLAGEAREKIIADNDIVVGNEPCVMIDFTGAKDYAKGSGS